MVLLLDQESPLITGYSFDELKTIWGFDIEEENDISLESTSSNVVLVVSYSSVSNTTSSESTTTYTWIATITIDTVFAGDKYEEAASDDFVVEGNEITESDTNSLSEVVADSGAITWIRKFLTFPPGAIVNLILDLFKELADAIQMLINFAQTIPLGIYNDWTMKYEYSTLSQEGYDGIRNQYTNVSTENDTSDYEYSIEIDDTSDTNGDKYYFEDTKIPIIYVDFYTMALNKVNILDINFFTGDQNHDENSLWTKVRNTVAAIIFISFYVAAGFLIGSLIWTGVKIVVNSSNPNKAAKDKQELNKFVNGVIMLIGTILIMALSIFGYQAVAGDLYDEDSNELPIRVYFDQEWSAWAGLAGNYDVEYSFSTTLTGYVRFMAEIENPYRCLEKAGYVIVYIALVVANFIIFVGMFIRMILIWLLSIAGPIVATLYVISSNEKIMDLYKNWVMAYVVLALIQIILVIIYVVLLNVIFA